MPNTYTLLETITVGAAGASSVTFNSIPQTGYTDLVVKFSGRNTAASTQALITFNGTTSTYTGKRLYGDGATATSDASNTANFNPSSIVPSTATANTFGNSEIYIPNYTSSNFKSVSIDGVTENNATTAFGGIFAGLWSTTSAITSVTLTANSGNWTQHSTFSLYGVSALGVTPTKAPKATGGSIIQTDGTYWYHAFLSSGTFTPATALSCDYLVVAGGGGGGAADNGAYNAGGGGAGGLRSTVTATGGGGSLESALSLASGTGYTVTIGAGGAGATAANLRGSNGSNSVFSTITSTGGGGGAGGSNGTQKTGSTGGSGGGGGDPLNGANGAGTTNQGYAGGTGSDGYRGGGGGGAGAVGGNATNTSVAGATGGAGVQITAFATTTGTGANSGYYAGGGGGSGYNSLSASSNGGGGQGGIGGSSSPAATSGTANTGSGGGGGFATPQVPAGNTGSGGSGIVIIRYLAA